MEPEDPGQGYQAGIAAPAAGEVTTRTAEPRESLDAAGWSNRPRMRLSGAYDSLSWGNIRTLVAARREKTFGQNNPDDAAGAMRQVWLGDDPPRVPLSLAEDGATTRVIILGDTGDGSEAQMAVAQQVFGRATRAGETRASAVLIQSDIVYPAGAVNEYSRKFFRPYERIHRENIPIYAIPGNHDWDDGALAGFRSVFCESTGTSPEAYAARDSALTSWQRRFWGPKATECLRSDIKGAWETPPSGTGPTQTTPYLALDIGGVLYIGIDTGFGSCTDYRQAEWLVDIVQADAHRDKPKILFTGKPLIVNGEQHPCPFAGPGVVERAGKRYCSVDDVVRDPDNGFVAAIGGDVHNYQRYRVHITRADGRQTELPYVVAGGGGVFIGQTYWIPPIDATGRKTAGDVVSISEGETVFFPTRAHSFLYWDKLARQSLGNASFAASVALAAAALLCIPYEIAVVAKSSLLDLLDVPLLLLVALSANMSARPITWRARIAVPALAAAVGVISLWRLAGDRSLDLGLGRAGTCVALVGGVTLLQVAEFSGFGRGPARLVRALFAIAACGLLAVGGTGFLATSFGHGTPAEWRLRTAALIMTLAVLAVLGLTRCFRRNPSIGDTFAAITTELTSPGASHDLTPALRLARRYGDHQKTFSIFETFNDGRLKHKVWRPFREGERSYFPLYRSFLDIESRRDADGVWRIDFTVYAVTGEDTTDTGGDVPPVVVDKFAVEWQTGVLEFTLGPAPA